MTKKSQYNWPIFCGIGALLVAISIAISGHSGQALAHLQGGYWNSDRPIEQVAVYYWAVLFYNYAGLPLTGLLLVMLIVILFSLFWKPKGKTYLAYATPAAIGLCVLALAIASLSVFSLLLIHYHHLTSAEFDGYRYNVGLRTAFLSPSFYIIGKCDRFGIRCDCYTVMAMYAGEDTILKTPHLEQDAKTKIIYIKTESRKIPIYDLPSKK